MGIDAWIQQQLHPERIDDAATTELMTRYPVFAMTMPEIIRDYNLVQQLQREVKKIDAADSTMNRAQARRDVLRDDPKTAALPSADEIREKTEERRTNLRAQRLLKDLRRDAIIEYR